MIGSEEVAFVPSRASMILLTVSLTISTIVGVDEDVEEAVSTPPFSDWIPASAGMTETSMVDVAVSSVLVAVEVATISSVVVAIVFASSVKIPVATSLPYEKILNICIESPLFTPWRIILSPVLISESEMFEK